MYQTVYQQRNLNASRAQKKKALIDMASVAYIERR